MNLRINRDNAALRSAHLTIIEDNILEIKFHDFIEISYRDARELIAAIAALLPEGGPVIFQYGLGVFLTHEARIELTTSRSIHRAAFLAYTQTSTLLVNFLLRYSETTYPAQVFQSRQQAIGWLTASESNKSDSVPVKGG
jgi:hypothetical protein